MTKDELKALVNKCIAQQGNQSGLDGLSAILNAIIDNYGSASDITAIESQIGNLADLETDHKSSMVESVNELADVLGTTELVVDMAQSFDERKAIYDICARHPQLAKNIVFYVPDDGLYYGINGYNFANDLLTLHVIMKDSGTGLRHSTFQIASNGSIAVI